MLKRGAKGDFVLSLQKRLTELGYKVGAIDGEFGPKTEAAVKALQKDSGLAIDGVYGSATAGALALGVAAARELEERAKEVKKDQEETHQNDEKLPDRVMVAGRDIHDEFFKWIFDRLPETWKKLSPSALYLVVLEIFEREKIREVGGNNKGKIVEWMQDTVGNVVREPWCVSAPQSAIAFVERLLGVKSLVPVSEHVQSTYNLAPDSIKTKKFASPVILCYALYDKSGKKTSSGHMATGVSLNDKGIATTLEGNTGPQNDRDGDGFYRRQRNLSGFGRFKLMGMLKVF